MRNCLNESLNLSELVLRSKVTESTGSCARYYTVFIVTTHGKVFPCAIKWKHYPVDKHDCKRL